MKIIIAFFTLFTLTSCIRNVDTITIAAIIPLTGSGEEIGLAVKNGITLAVDEINSKGGVDGIKVKFVYKDNESRVDTVLNLFDEIERTESPVFYISVFSYLTFPLSVKALEKSVPLIGIAVGSEEFTKLNGYCYRFAPDNNDEISALISHLSDFNAETLAIVSVDDPYGKSLSIPLSKKFKESDGQYEIFYYKPQTTDFNYIKEELLGKDAVFSIGFNPNVSGVMKLLEENDYKGYVLGASNIVSPEYHNVYVSKEKYAGAPLIYNHNFVYAKTLRDNFESRFNKLLDHYSAGAYETTHIMTSLLEETEYSGKDLAAKLSNGFSYIGVFGEVNCFKGKRDILYPLKKAIIFNKEVIY